MISDRYGYNSGSKDTQQPIFINKDLLQNTWIATVFRDLQQQFIPPAPSPCSPSQLLANFKHV